MGRTIIFLEEGGMKNPERNSLQKQNKLFADMKELVCRKALPEKIVCADNDTDTPHPLQKIIMVLQPSV